MCTNFQNSSKWSWKESVSIATLLVALVLAVGLDLTSGAGLAQCESYSLSRADLFPEMKLKASFSAVSHFAVLALTHSSKVLQRISFWFVSSMVLKETVLVPVLSIVLKETHLVPLLSMVLKETLLVPLLPMALKEVTFSSQTYPLS